MNGEIEEEAPRPRPLSSGIWTLFSWLRRTDRSSSSESIGSVGSDLTVASFDFLAPLHYKHNPIIELPQSPLTDTYKKRLNERNLRRQYDRDITLRRKYGLYREEVLEYDGFSLPSAKKIQRDSPTRRDRRAASECFQRRAPYVPGKRRAPLPPRIIISNTLPRSYKRKRQAPKPPPKVSGENKENVNFNKYKQMDSKTTSSKYSISKDIVSQKRLENNVKDNISQDVKLRPEKSFIKQFFDNRKRNSAIDTSHVKWLPSISELDKQAAEIIAAKRMADSELRDNKDISENSSTSTASSSNEKMWICKMCLTKYNASVASCLYCVKSDRNKKIASNIYTQTEKNVATSSKNLEDNEKKKLKEMLKEMKDSLPKRPKHNGKNIVEGCNNLSLTETPTLRIGSPTEMSGQVKPIPVATLTKIETKSLDNKIGTKDLSIISHPSSPKQSIVNILENSSKLIRHIKDMDEKYSNNDSSNDEHMSILNSRKYNFLVGSKSTHTANLPTKVFDNGLSGHSSKNEIFNDTKQISLVNEVTITGNIKIKNDQPEPVKTRSQSPNSNINNETTTSDNIISKKTPENNKQIDISNQNNKEPSLKPNENHFSINFESKNHLTDASKNNLLEPVLHNIDFLNKKMDLNKRQKIERLHLGDVILPPKVNVNETRVASKANLNTPLKISSLLNPFYLPKNESLNSLIPENHYNKNLETKSNGIVSPTAAIVPSTSKPNSSITHTSHGQKSDPNIKQHNESQDVKKISKISNINQHAKRRDLINQLESAISKGDERTASEAAANLAKLKLSCSVLSFSSQIVGLVNNTHNNGNENQNSTKDSKIQESATKRNDKEIQQNQQAIKLATSFESTTEPNSLPSTSKQNPSEEMVSIQIWIEDKEAVRGPIRMHVNRKAVMGDLKKLAEVSLGLDIRLQRWIVGKNLCSNDYTPLITLAGPYFGAPFYLCLVESGTNKDETHKINVKPEVNNKTVPNTINYQQSCNVYTELMKLEQQALVPNTEDFECGVCIEQCAAGNGAVLRECIHTFCRDCLSDVVRHCEEATVSCPAIGCLGTLQEREIRALLPPEEYDRWLARSLTTVESGTRNTFHCRTRDCTGWAFCEPGVRRFPCPVCKHTNCLPCQAVHENETCEQYQAKLLRATTVTEINHTDEGTKALLESLIKRGEALECPECSAIITKKWGCDWIKCSSCKTEICWVTKGRRWGPAGKGDTSGGCRCGVDGKRCHPSCGYCH